MKEKQGINFFSLTMIVVSLVIGMGIFKTPATIAAKSGTPLIFFSAWLIGGLIALFGARQFLRSPITDNEVLYVSFLLPIWNYKALICPSVL